MIRLFAAFAFADEAELGFDLGMKPVPDNPGQFDITVHPSDAEESPRTFRTVELLSSFGAEPLRGRGTRVFKAIELDESENPKGQHVVLKDIWIDSDRMREGNILTELYEAAEENDKPLVLKYFLTAIFHGDVRTISDSPDDTAKCIMRGLNIDPDRGQQFVLQHTPVLPPNEKGSGSAVLREACQVPVYRPRIIYAPKTHYRIVFAEICKPIDDISSLSDVMSLLSEAARGAF